MEIIISSKNSCPACNATDRALKKNKIADHPAITKQKLEDMADQDAFRAELKSKNFSAFPVVETDTPVGSWCGYNPDKIKELAAYIASLGEGTELVAAANTEMQVA